MTEDITPPSPQEQLLARLAQDIETGQVGALAIVTIGPNGEPCYHYFAGSQAAQDALISGVVQLQHELTFRRVTERIRDNAPRIQRPN